MPMLVFTRCSSRLQQVFSFNLEPSKIEFALDKDKSRIKSFNSDCENGCGSVELLCGTYDHLEDFRYMNPQNHIFELDLAVRACTNHAPLEEYQRDSQDNICQSLFGL